MKALYLYSLDNTQPMTAKIKAGANIVDGDIVHISSGLAVPVTAASTTVIGIAMGSASTGDMARVMLLNAKSVVRVGYTGATKTTLTDADKFGTKFDWDATNKKVNLDDTTGGMFRVVAYDNTKGTADCVVAESTLWTA